MPQGGFFFARARARSTGRRAGRAAVVLLAVFGMLAQATPAQAFKPYTHIATGQAVLDDVADGEVTIGGRTYEVPHHVHTALTRYPSYFNAGVVGPDGFPDLTFGQSVIHSGQTGEWLEHLLDLATIPADQTDPPEDRYKALAWTYGFMLHTIGDMWAHTFVNELSGGVFPGIGEMAEDLSEGELEKIAIAVRHTILEGYIGDATPGYDGNPAPSEIDSDGDGHLDDVSSIATPGIELDAPINFIYHALVNPERPLPVGTCGDGEGQDVYGDGVDDDGDGVVDDGCPHSPYYTVGEPEPVRGPLIDFFLDLQSDLELARAEYAADERHTDCTEADWDCYERKRTVAASTVRGLRSTEITVYVCEGATVGCVASPTDAGDDLIINEILIAYIDAWIDDIKTGLRHWPELGLAISRALFDPQTRRDIQDDLCESEDYDQWSEARRECEDKLGAIDYVSEQTTDFQQDYLYSMLGAPDFVGSFAGTMGEISEWISDAVGPTNNPISWAIDEVKDIAKEKIKEMIEERYGVDIDEIKAILHQPTKILYEGGLDLDTPDVYLPLFDDQAHPRIDEVLGLPADHHESEEEGYRLESDVEFDPSTMPLFQNTVTLGKLAMLDGPGLDQVLSDMTGESVTYYQKFPDANIMTVGAGSDVSDAAPLIRGAAQPITLDLDHPDRIMGTYDPAAVVNEAEMASTSLTSTLAALGDVNGDGIDDFAIGAPTDDFTQLDYGAGGIVYVVFGPLALDMSALDLAELNQPGGPSGYRIVGRPDQEWTRTKPEQIKDSIGEALEAAGDVNGDGLADVMFAGGSGQHTYIVYGQADTADISLADLQTPASPLGVRIDGFSVTAGGGDGVSGQNELIDSAGDFNGDGYDDVLIGDESYFDYDLPEWSIDGAAVVLYGGPDLAGPIDLPEILARRDDRNRPTGDPRMLVLVSPTELPGDTPNSVAGVGDLDGDGLDDIALTVPRGYTRGVYVVYGGTTLRTVPYTCTDHWRYDEERPEAYDGCRRYAGTRDHWQGWRIGESEYDSPSWPYDEDAPFDIRYGLESAVVEGVGDMTGDGVPDIAYVADSRHSISDSWSEDPHVVMIVAGGDHSGQYGPALGQTMRILGARGDNSREENGGSRDGHITEIEPAGDVDGDGLQDLAVVSVAGTYDEPETHERHVAVVFGRDMSGMTGTIDIDLEQLRGTPSAAGVMIEGSALAIPHFALASPRDTFVASAGDNDGDGRDEILIGVGSTSRDGVPGVGAVYHVGGFERPLVDDPTGEPTTDLVPWLRSIDGDHAWRSDGLPIFDRESGGNGNFPLWESCMLRDPVFRELFVDWETEDGSFPALGDDPSVILEGSTTAEVCGLDGDGIESEIDGHMVDGSFVDESDAPTTRFTDQAAGGTTHGVVVDDGGLMVEAERHADGVALWATGTGGPATFELCQDPVWDLALGAGDSGIATCGSLTWRSTAGEAVVTSGDHTVEIPAGAIAKMRTTGDGLVVEVPAESGGAVVVTGPDGSETIGPAAPPDDEDDGSGGGATPDPDPDAGAGGDGEPEPPLAEACRTAADAFADDAASVHETAIDCLAHLGLLEGFEDGTIRAGDDVTRGQAAGMLMRLVAAQRGEDMEAICPDGGDPLPDGGATFGAAVACLHRLGVVAGHADGTYRPNEDVTRSQAASLVARTASVLGLELPTGGQLVFDDVAPAGPHREAIGRLAAADILEGYDSTTFGPNDTLTRGQLASVLARLVGWTEQQPSG